MRRLALCLLCCVSATVALGSTPAALPPNLPPLHIPAVPRVHPTPNPGPPFGAWTHDKIRELNLSSTVKLDLLTHLFPEQPQIMTSPADTLLPPRVPSSLRATHRQFAIQPNTTVDTVRADNDVSQDIEPAIITNRYTENAQTVDRTTTVFTKLDANAVPSHWWTSTTDFATFTPQAQLPIPTPANRSSDPMLSENPYASCTGCPIAFPKRTYAVGVSYNLNGPNGGYGDTILTVWFTDHVADPSKPWTTLIVNSGFNPLFFDKPSICTSWDISHGTLGYTYIAVVLENLNTGYNDIQIYRQTTTEHFDLVHTFQYLNTTVTSPIINVDNETGDVYVLWADPYYGTISIARSTDMGNTFATAVAFTAERLVRTNICNNWIWEDRTDGQHFIHVRAVTALMARYNQHDRSIGVAWHLREADGLHTDIGFNRFQLVTQQWTNYRGRPLGHVTADLYDQWDPALDPADDGTYMTQWYDKRNDINNGMKTQWNNLYQVYACKILPDGTPVDGTDTLVYSTTAADPSALPNLQGTCLGDANRERYMGEYQDIWEWYGTWYGATTYIANSQQDIYLTRISP